MLGGFGGTLKIYFLNASTGFPIPKLDKIMLPSTTTAMLYFRNKTPSNREQTPNGSGRCSFSSTLRALPWQARTRRNSRPRHDAPFWTRPCCFPVAPPPLPANVRPTCVLLVKNGDVFCPHGRVGAKNQGRHQVEPHGEARARADGGRGRDPVHKERQEGVEFYLIDRVVRNCLCVCVCCVCRGL